MTHRIADLAPAPLPIGKTKKGSADPLHEGSSRRYELAKRSILQQHKQAAPLPAYASATLFLRFMAE